MDSGYSQKQDYPSQPSQQGYAQLQEIPLSSPPQNTNYSDPSSIVIVRQTQSQPHDHLAFAIIVTICCCLPLGIVAIVKSINVRNRFVAGDFAGAEEASRSTKCWSIAGLVTGIVLYAIGIVIIIIYVVFAVSVVSTAAEGFDNIADGFDESVDFSLLLQNN